MPNKKFIALTCSPDFNEILEKLQKFSDCQIVFCFKKDEYLKVLGDLRKNIFYEIDPNLSKDYSILKVDQLDEIHIFVERKDNGNTKI